MVEALVLVLAVGALEDLDELAVLHGRRRRVRAAGRVPELLGLALEAPAAEGEVEGRAQVELEARVGRVPERRVAELEEPGVVEVREVVVAAEEDRG